MKNKKQHLSENEARDLHEQALVIDTQQPPATSGFIFTEKMKLELLEMEKLGYNRQEASSALTKVAEQEIRTSASARAQYLGLWKRSGVNIASGTYSAGTAIENAFMTATEGIAQARSYIDALDGELKLILNSKDIEEVYNSGKRGLIIDFQDTLPFGTDLNKIEYFYNLGLRVVQLTYNLRNLVGDGCTEKYKSGLSYFGRTVVEKLNEL